MDESSTFLLKEYQKLKSRDRAASSAFWFANATLLCAISSFWLPSQYMATLEDEWGIPGPHLISRALNIPKDTVKTKFDDFFSLAQISMLAMGILLLILSGRIKYTFQTNLSRKDMENLGDKRMNLAYAAYAKDETSHYGASDGHKGRDDRRSRDLSGRRGASGSGLWPSLYGGGCPSSRSAGNSGLSSSASSSSSAAAAAAAMSPSASMMLTSPQSSSYASPATSTLYGSTSWSPRTQGSTGSGRTHHSRVGASPLLDARNFDPSVQSSFFGGSGGHESGIDTPGSADSCDGSGGGVGLLGNGSSRALRSSDGGGMSTLASERVQWTSPHWRPYTASPQSDQASRSGRATGTMKHLVKDVFDEGRPARLDHEMDELRRGLHLYIKNSLREFDATVDAIAHALKSSTPASDGDVEECRRLLKLEAGHDSYGGTGGILSSSSVASVESAKQRVGHAVPALLAEYEAQAALFTLGAITGDRVNAIHVAERTRQLVPGTDSHLGGLSSTTSGRSGTGRRGHGDRGIAFKTTSDAEIVMNAFFHLCDAGSGFQSYDKFSALHFAQDLKSAKEKVHNSSSAKAGIFCRKPSHPGCAPVYTVFYQDSADFSFVELRVPDGGKNCLYAIHALLKHFRLKGSMGQMLPQGLDKLCRDVFRNSS